MAAMQERRNGVDVVGGGCLLRLSGGVTSIYSEMRHHGKRCDRAMLPRP